MSEARTLFPHTANQSYLNSAGVGLAWTGTGAAAAEFYDRAKVAGLDGRPAWIARTSEALDRLARLLCVRPDRLQFVGSATEAMNLVAHSLSFAPGQHVLMLDDDHPAAIQPWLSGPHRALARVMAKSGKLSRTDRLLTSLDDDTAAVVFSLVDAATGECVDLPRIAAACRPRGTLVIVDGSQATGCIDVNAALSDVYLGSTFKWLVSGFGLGYLYLSNTVSKRLEPVFRGVMNPPPSTSLRYGHLNLCGIYVLAASTAMLEELGWPGIFDQVRRLSARLHAGLGALGASLLSERAESGIVAIACDAAQEVRHRLAMRGVSVQMHPHAIRMSPHFYNSEADIDRALRAISDIARDDDMRRALRL